MAEFTSAARFTNFTGRSAIRFVSAAWLLNSTLPLVTSQRSDQKALDERAAKLSNSSLWMSRPRPASSSFRDLH